MSASFRSHFTGASERTVRAELQQSRASSSTKPAPNENTARHGAKLAKKGSRLPTAFDRSERSTAPQGSSDISPTPRNVDSQLIQRSTPMSSSWDMLPPPPTLRTPSLVSGSSISTFESPKANVLRRKRSTIGKYVADKKEALGIELDMDDTVLGIPMPANTIPPSVTPVSFMGSDAIYTTAGTIASSSPSTRFTDSPFSHAPTPSSFSSISTAPTSHNVTSNLSQELGRDTASVVSTLHNRTNKSRSSMLPTSMASTSSVQPQRTKLVLESKLRKSNTAATVKPEILTESTISKKKPRQPVNPPELAHLTSISPVSDAPTPARPSREGASGITFVSPISPVVQSDLPLATFHKRTPSRDSYASSSSGHGLRSRFGLSPKPSAKQESTKSQAEDTTVASAGRRNSSSAPPQPEAVAQTKSRFAFLKKSKDEVPKSVDKPKREPRKMPTAGTGHERYGRFGFGQRNASVSTSIGGRSPSSDSLLSLKSPSRLRRKSSGASDKTSELDEFLRDRLTPVVLRGSGARPGSTSSPSMATAHDLEQTDDPSNLELTLTRSQTSTSVPSPPKLRSPDVIRPSSANAISRGTTLKAGDEIQRPSTSTPVEADGGEALWLRTGMVEKRAPKKWNFLQRLHHSPAHSHAASASALRSNLDNAAHSALMDAIEPIELVEVEEIAKGEDKDDGKINIQSPEDRILLPSVDIAESSAAHPRITDSTSTTTLHTPELGSDSPRVPRLSPIGRIPQIVSKRDRERKLPDTSFSRPFITTQPRPNVKPPGALYNQIRDHASPIEPAVVESPQEQAILDGHRQGEYIMHSASNLFSWPSRKNSDFSYTSSSDTASWLAYSRMQAMQDEDVWDEFDDFMDDEALGRPSQYHKMSYSTHSPPYREPISVQDASYFHIPVTQTSYFGRPPTREPAMALPTPPRLSRDDDSKIDVLAQPSLWKITEPIRQHSMISGVSADSSRNSRISTRSRAASFGEVNMRSSHTSFSSTARLNRESIRAQAEAHSTGMHATVNLKLESLMTSKLLSFGRVLFSPAHNEMRLADEPRVLILDGLGSDWSYFVAMFYPQATIYNLGPSGKQSTAREGLQQLPNHRNIAHSDVNAPLPFPKGFFTAAVFRFPIATTDQAYNSCIAEFKRVLRPGGHLEVTVLDIDLGNAGDCARKAIRGLKTRLQQRQENVSLRSLSDFMLQAIGKRGFESVQRCIIGVPVMSRSSPRSGSSSSGSDNGKASHRASDFTQHSKAIANLVEHATQQDLNVKETSEEKMTKSVARVGRWWYSQCYEKSVLTTDQSIWADAALLSECQTQNSSFKLLICYAQKPTQARRRTMSV